MIFMVKSKFKNEYLFTAKIMSRYFADFTLSTITFVSMEALEGT